MLQCIKEANQTKALKQFLLLIFVCNCPFLHIKMSAEYSQKADKDFK